MLSVSGHKGSHILNSPMERTWSFLPGATWVRLEVGLWPWSSLQALQPQLTVWRRLQERPWARTTELSLLGFRMLRNCCHCCLFTTSCPAVLRHHVLYPAKLLCPWDFAGKKTGAGCHFPLHFLSLPFTNSKGSYQPRDWIHVSCIGRRILLCEVINGCYFKLLKLGMICCTGKIKTAG